MTAAEIAGLFGELELLLVNSLRRNLARHKKQEKDEGGKAAAALAGGVPGENIKKRFSEGMPPARAGTTPEHWEAWQAAKLRDLARFRRENRALLGQYAPRIDAETRAMIEQQAAEGGSDGFFVMNDRRVKALIGEMQTAEARAEKAALRYMDDVYRRTVRTAAAGMATGSMTLPQAVDQATRDFLAAGIRCIRYKDGRQVNIASYAEMALRTAATRAFLIGQAEQRERLGIDTVLVSQYGGCSKTCLPWQGLVYIDDVWQDYRGESNLAMGGSYGRSRNGRSYPLLSVAVKAGLFHPNCRHTLTTWIEGVSRRPRPMDKAKIEAVSRLEQKQRALERDLRQAKRQAAGLMDERAAAEAKKRVREAQKELREFVDKHGDVLRRDYWRERDTGVQPLRHASVSPPKMLHSLNLEPRPVTMESISRLKPFACSTLDAAGSMRLMNRHKQLLQAVYRLGNLNREVGWAFSLDMEPLTELLSGKTEGSKINVPDQAVLYIAIHTHPDCNTFSPDDLQLFTTRANLKLLTAVGHDGTVYAIEKLENYDASAAAALIDVLNANTANLSGTDADTVNTLEEQIEKCIREMSRYGVRYIVQ